MFRGLINRVLVVYKPAVTCFELAVTASSTLRRYGLDVYSITVDDLSRFKPREGMPRVFDLIVSVGGDGTFIRASKLAESTTLILPYPCGRRNAFYEYLSFNINEAIEKVINGDFHLEFLPLYMVYTSEIHGVFVNDAVVISTDLGRASSFRIDIETPGVKSSIMFEGDGLIIATPHGSSGHSLSAHGPLLTPEAETLVITPLNPIQLGTPSFVTPLYSNTRVWCKRPVNLYLDGDLVATLPENSLIEFKRANKLLKVIRFYTKRDLWRNIIEPRCHILQ